MIERRAKRLGHRRSLVCLLLLLAVPPLWAQQERWQELDARALELYGQGQFDQATPLAEEALRLGEAALAPNDPSLASLLLHLGAVYREQGKYGQAEPLLQRALSIWEKALGPNDANVAIALSHLAKVYQEGGEYARAEPLNQRALRILEEARGPEHPDVATALDNLAGVYEDEGKYRKAEPLSQRALAIREKALGPTDPDVGRSLNNLAEIYDDEGKLAQAEALYRRALEIAEHSQEPLETAMSLSNLAELYAEEGKYGEAEPLYQRALSLKEKVLGPADAGLAIPLNNLALLYVDEGKYVEAEPLLRRALKIDEQGLGPDHPSVAVDLNNLAELYMDQGQEAQAEPLYQRSLTIREKALGPEHPNVATALDNLAVVYQDEGKYAQAEALFQRALSIDEKALGRSHPAVATDLNDLAMLYFQQDQYAAAVPLFERALAIQEQTLGREHPKLGTVLDNLAGVRVAQGEPQRAQPLFARAFDILFRQFQYHFTYMTEKDRLAFLATVSDQFPHYFSFVQRFHAKMPELAGSMYDLLLWEKGFIASSEAVLRRQVEASGDSEALRLLDQLAGKRAQIAALINTKPTDREVWRQQVEQLEAEADGLEKALVARSAAFAQQKQLERVTWQQVRDALKPGEAAVEFVRFPFFDGKQWTDTSYYVALAVTPETKDQPQYVVLGEGKQLEGAPGLEFQQQVQARGMEEAPATGIAPGGQAYDLFWKPLEPLLAGKKRVYLSPDGVLNQMPLGLILAPDGKLLMETYDLRLVSSTKDLLRPATTLAPNTAVLVGNPAFNLGEAQQRAALGTLAMRPAAEPIEMAMLTPSARSRDQGTATTLPALPGTGAEIQAVSRLLEQQHWQTTAYTGERALEEAVKQARSPRLLHLATHGFFLADQEIKRDRMSLGGGEPSGLEDPMLRSGLYFAGADRALAHASIPEDLDDGVLTAYEASSLNLQGTELVVLSACNTGQGEVQNGEGVFGLRRALQIAGAQAVMMSLWSVPDKETQELMALFYSKWLAGMEKHEALRQAQLEERAVVQKRYGRDLPYYWGAFVLVGR